MPRGKTELDRGGGSWGARGCTEARRKDGLPAEKNRWLSGQSFQSMNSSRVFSESERGNELRSQDRTARITIIYNNVSPCFAKVKPVIGFFPSFSYIVASGAYACIDSICDPDAKLAHHREKHSCHSSLWAQTPQRNNNGKRHFIRYSVLPFLLKAQPEEIAMQGIISFRNPIPE